MTCSRPHPPKQGFTLIELLLAIVITGLVGLVAFAAITGGIDTLARIDSHRRESQSRALVRPLIADALRHVADAGNDGSPVFQITRSSATGSGEKLTFLTRGVESPMGSSGLWEMSVWTTATGMQVRAEPVENVAQSPILASVPGVSEIRVRVLATKDDELWVTNWDAPRQHPYAVKLELLDSTGNMIDAPLVVATSLEGAR